MRVGRVGEVGEERPVVLDADGVAYALDAITPDIDRSFFESGGLDRVRQSLDARELTPTDIEGLRWGSPVAEPGMLMCVGLNYRQHAIETGATFPVEPILFMKSSRCVVGPNDPVIIPRGSTLSLIHI